MDMKQYQSEAHVTASSSFFGSFVGTNHLLAVLNDAIAAIAKVDKLKKQLFYGRNLPSADYMHKIDNVASLNMTEQEQAIFHALIGIGTEGGECLELLHDFIAQAGDIHGQVFDNAKVMEELGSAMWYIPIGAQAMGVTMADIAELNIGQLRVRYAGKFDAYEANNRNLAAENKVLSELSGELSEGEKGVKLNQPHDYAIPQFHGRVKREVAPTADDEKQRYKNHADIIRASGADFQHHKDKS